MSLISKIYYINLDKRVDRRTFMENQLSEFDIPYERFPAVLVKRDELINKNSEYKHIYNKFLPEHYYSKITESEKQFRHYRGSIGAYISFYSLLKSLVKTKQNESVLIIQDDCVLKKGWFEIFQSFISNRDLPVVQALAIILASIYVSINLIADLMTLMLNPRLKTLQIRK